MVGFIRAHRDGIAGWCALIVPPGACAALIPVRGTLANTEAALLSAAFVVAVAALGNRFAGYVAAAGAAVWFDFFLTLPYERLTITRHTDAQTTLLLLCVGVATTELAVAARRRARVVAVDEALLAVVQSTAALVARGQDASMVTGQVTVQLKALLALRGCSSEPGRGRARGLRLESDGVLRWGTARWRLEEHGFPDERIELPAHYGGRMYGCFALDPTPGTAPGIHARRTAVVLADLAAAALAGERASAHGA